MCPCFDGRHYGSSTAVPRLKNKKADVWDKNPEEMALISNVDPDFISRVHTLLSCRWWNLPGHLQGLFTHGFKQPREAETPQCWPQNLTLCCLAFTPPCAVQQLLHTVKTHASILATCHMFSHSSAGVDLRRDEHSKHWILCASTSDQNNCVQVGELEQLYGSSVRCLNV